MLLEAPFTVGILDGRDDVVLIREVDSTIEFLVDVDCVDNVEISPGEDVEVLDGRAGNGFVGGMWETEEWDLGIVEALLVEEIILLLSEVGEMEIGEEEEEIDDPVEPVRLVSLSFFTSIVDAVGEVNFDEKHCILER